MKHVAKLDVCRVWEWAYVARWFARAAGTEFPRPVSSHRPGQRAKTKASQARSLEAFPSGWWSKT